jgi:dTDP-4-dehydrorhamnose reductase
MCCITNFGRSKIYLEKQVRSKAEEAIISRIACSTPNVSKKKCGRTLKREKCTGELRCTHYQVIFDTSRIQINAHSNSTMMHSAMYTTDQK